MSVPHWSRIVCAILFSVLVTGCFSKKQNPMLSISDTSTYVKAIYSVPPTLDPAQMNDTASLAISNLIYDGLVSFSADLELKAVIAKSWQTSRDGKTLTFELRSNAKFQDGTPITALDVKRSLERNLSPNSKVYTYYDCIVGAERFHSGQSKDVLGIRAPRTDSVEIELKYPFPPFLSVLAGATAKVLPVSKIQGLEFFEKPVGSGPFVYDSIQKFENHTDIVLLKNENYFSESPKIKKIILRAMDEKTARVQAVQGLVHDLSSYPLNGEEEVFSLGNEITAPLAATWIIGLNTRFAPFKNEKIRKAFRDSIDVEKFRKQFHPDAIPAQGYIPPGLPGFEWSYQKPVTAKSESKALAKTKISIAIPEVLAESNQIKIMLENSLKAHGWNVEVIPMEWNKMMDAYSKKSLQAFLVSMNMDYPDTEFLVRNFESNNPDNFSGLHDKAVDELIRKARATQDRVIRRNLYVDLVGLLHKKAATVDLFHPRGHYWVHPCVKGFKPNILADVYIDYRDVSLESKCEREPKTAKNSTQKKQGDS